MRCLLFVGIALAALLIGMVLAAFICWMPVRTDDHSQVIDPAVDVIDPTLHVRTDHPQQVIIGTSMPGKHAGPPQCNYIEDKVRRVKLKGMLYIWLHFLSLAVLHNLSSATCNYNHVMF